MSVSIYDYFDYRIFLKDFLHAKKAQRGTFSMGTLIAKVPGISKPLLSLIIGGKRNLAPAKVEPLGKAMALSCDHLRYFQNLVHFNQARTTTEKEFFLDQLVAARPRSPARTFEAEQYQALRNWHCMIVRELVRLPKFDPSPAAISRRLHSRIKTSEAKRAFEMLCRTGMVQQTDDGSYVAEHRTIKSSDEVASVMLRAYHKSCLELGKQILDEVPVTEREYASVNTILTREQFLWVKNQIKKFRGEVGALPFEGGTGRGVYQMNIQFFPLAEEVRDESPEASADEPGEK